MPYVYAVKLKTGPMFALLKVKNWSIFVFVCYFMKDLILPAERRRFLKNTQNEKKKKKKSKIKKTTTTNKNTFLKVKKWSNYVAQHTWTNFNFNLDQF